MNKNKKILSLIQECIREVINEEMTGSVQMSAANPRSQDPNYLKRYTQQGLNVNISENDTIEEMARIGSKYKLAEYWEDALNMLPEKYQKSPWVKGIIEFLQNPEKCPSGEAQIITISQGQFDRPQQSIFMLVTKELVPKGVLEPSTGEAVDKHQDFVTKKAKAEKAGEEFDEEDALYQGWNPTKKLSDFFNGDDPDEMFVGPYFDDEIGDDSKGTLHIGGDEKDKRKTTTSMGGHKGTSNARSKAAEWFSDDANDKELHKLIQVQASAKTRGGSLKERRLKEGDDPTISASDFHSSETRRNSSAKEDITTLVQAYADKIKLEDPDVQRAILNMLQHKLPGHNQNLWKKIVAAVGLPSADSIVAKKEKQQLPSLSDEEIEDIVNSEEDVYDSSDLPDDKLDEEDCSCTKEKLDEGTKRLQILAGLIK